MGFGRMHNRWFHRPFLHSPALGDALRDPRRGMTKKVTWLELFFDLVFVAAFIQLGNGLSRQASLPGVAAFLASFVSLWVAWTGFTFYVNRFTVDDFVHRTIVFLQMLAVGATAVAATFVLGGKTFAFSLAAGAASLPVAVLYARALPQVPEARDFSRYWGGVFALSSAVWFGSAFVPAPYNYGLWAAATLVVLGAPLSRQSRALGERFPIDLEHLGERYGLLTLIVLGESFVKVVGSLVDGGAGLALYAEAAFVLVITCGVWWVYFDDVAGSHVRHGPGNWIIWLYAHVPLQASIVVLGVALNKAMKFGWDAPAPSAYRWLLAGSLAAVYFSVAAIDSVTERRQAELSDRSRVNARWGSALLLLVLAPAGRSMSGGMFLALVAAVNVAQVIFDMMLAPFEQSEHMERGKKSTAEIAREREQGIPNTRPRRALGQAVIKGAPATLRRDLYFYFMEGSWTRVFAAFAFVFVMGNVFFAGLYTLEPDSINGARADSFADAFFFSVQTMGTIGYGVLSPKTAYANGIVTAEAALSVIGLAVVTGLVFAKASRPRASVLFSDVLVLTKLHGKRVLMLRVGNARGNDVVDASLDLTVLKDEISPEGQHLRRMHELKLVRGRTPMFVLTWAVMHEIDETSPLHDIDWGRREEHLISIVATMMGHDGTYNQTTYARKTYFPEDIKVGERFVDVFHQLEDGRLMLDYNDFHRTMPDEQAGSLAPRPKRDSAAVAQRERESAE